ncbi:hypothetical protein [Cyclobacterium plantarum]|uniref:Uncharacterized protein n=1 Tax=Cyclobacterium plantarum TaxID=2716263 RepID=A0ABX0H7E9_9BACT|nr:hypothetical protein [Cyclobacterium plantarum]NHE56426.1 hypothetical protein [Cyclobacterium plantarum]
MRLAISCIGLLKKNNSGKFEIVARWYLNDDATSDLTTYLPNPEGKFVLTVKTKKSKEYLKADGTIAVGRPTGTADLPVIKPMNYLMFDPPTVGNSDPDNPKKTKPVAPIDPNDVKAEKGIGIYHILADSAKSSYPKKLHNITMKAINGNARARLSESLEGVERSVFADQFSRYLIDNLISPRNLQAIFVKEFKELEKQTFAAEAPLSMSELPSLFTFHLPKGKKLSGKKEISTHLESTWQMVSILSELLKNRDFLREMEEAVAEPENLKSQLSVLAGQGTEIIDYWCNPWQSQPNRVETDCGKKYSLAEALGLGVTLGEIESSKVQEWHTNGDSLLFNVSYIPPTKKALEDSEYDWDKFHDMDMVVGVQKLDSPTNIITTDGTNSLKNALDHATSCTVEQPLTGEFEYDIYMKRLIPDFDDDLLEKISHGENIEKGTGDGRALIKSQRPAEKPFPKVVSTVGDVIKEENSSIITGVNVYGLWQSEATADLKKYFDDPNLNPELDIIKPWRITRKYSYNKELKPFFAVDNPNIKAAQQNPPILPAFQQVDNTQNLEKILAVEENNRVINEEMPKRNEKKDEVIFSIDVRDGFRIDYNPNLPETWDKFPLDAREKEWQPEMQRGKTKKTGKVPQAYRFWVTAVDVFGQESEPMPVENLESSIGTVTNVFQFKYRAELQAPPSNDESTKDYIQIENKNGVIETKWQSPFKSELGHFGKTSRGTDRHPKDEIESNILYLRKRHRHRWAEVSDDQLDAHIDKMLAGLPVAFKNNQWIIGLTEVLKHNIDWEVFHAEGKLTNTASGHIWSHKITLKEEDSGYDYMALMNFSIRSDKRKFWVEDDPMRPINVTEQVKGPPLTRYKEYETTYINELPSTSQIAFTESILVSDQRSPRLVKLLPHEPSFLFARPVLGVQAIDRDLALSNILTTPNEVKDVSPDPNGDPIKSVVFKEHKEFLYTEVQDYMLNAALKRCNRIKELDLADAQRILKNELSNLNKEVFSELKGVDGKVYYAYDKDEVNEIVSTDLIGFRGLKQLKVRYNSVLSNFDDVTGEAEAVKLHLYQTRITLKRTSDFTYSFKAKSYERTSVSKFNKVTFGQKIEPEKYDTPLTLVVICESGYQVMPLKPVSAPQNGIYTLEGQNTLVDTSNGTVPKELLFVHGQQILEKSIELEDQLFYECDLLIPVGGGLRELFIWAIKTTSAIGNQSKGAQVFYEEYQTSILPQLPLGLEAWTISTPDERSSYALDNNLHVHWIPDELKVGNPDLKRQPRNFLKWTRQDELPTDIYLSIEREIREEQTLSTKLAKKDENSWELLSRIEKGLLVDEWHNPEGLIKMEWLENTGGVSLYDWLNLSEQVVKPGEGDVAGRAGLIFVGPGSKLFDPKRQLSMVDGLISDPLSEEPNVMFVDYFYDNEDLHFGMDTFRAYNYRVTSYIDIDPTGVLGLTHKYLYSKPGHWSGWVRPSFPSIEKIEKIGEESAYPEGQLTPKLQFSFELSRSKRLELLRNVKKNIFYRVIVKREIQNSISTYQNAPSGSEYLEIGEARNIPINPEPGEYIFIFDDRLERENLNDDLRLNYKLEVSVIARDADDKMILIREAKIVYFKGIVIEPRQKNEHVKIISLMIS